MDKAFKRFTGTGKHWVSKRGQHAELKHAQCKAAAALKHTHDKNVPEFI